MRINAETCTPSATPMETMIGSNAGPSGPAARVLAEATLNPANLLLNPRFERNEPLGGRFHRPTNWMASAFNPFAGVVTASCPAVLARRARHGACVAWVNDSLPSPGGPGAPSALYQTVRLGAGTYRFGGRLAVRVWDNTLDAVEHRVLNASKAFVRLYRGTVAMRPGTSAPSGADGAMLGSIDLSPQRFGFAAFRRVPTLGAPIRFAYVPFEVHEDRFCVDCDDMLDVTLQVAVEPRVPSGGMAVENLVSLTQITVLVDHLYIEPTCL